MFSVSLIFLLLFTPFISVSTSFFCVCVGVVLSVSSIWWGALSPGLMSISVISDQLSGNIIFLSLIVAGVSMAAGFGEGVLFFSLILISTFISLCFFMSSGMVGFFVFFEAGLVPLLFLILSWGYQPERLQACVCLVLYTVVGSLPIFILICGAYGVLSTSYIITMAVGFSVGDAGFNGFLWFFILLGFMVKLPVFGVHGWLPKAHVEAPAAGSIILAGVLLKFGGYGMIRVMWVFSWEEFILGEFLLGLSIWGGLLSSFICLIQSDLNSLIAYSSVSHISLVVVGIISCTIIGWSASLMMMVAHGLSSSILFGLANWSYGSFQSRSVLVCNGLLQVSPVVSALWFLGVVLSIGLPPGINFVSEFSLISSGLINSFVFLLPLAVISFITAGYSLYLFSLASHGGSSSFLFSSFIGYVDILSLVLSEFFLLVSFLMIDIFYLL